MTLPMPLNDETDDTAVIGDLDAFMTYVESGRALQDWHALCKAAAKEMDDFLRTRNRYWRHVGHPATGSAPGLENQGAFQE
jgi:hypothetical protein